MAVSKSSKSTERTSNEVEIDPGTEAVRKANAGYGKANPADPSLNAYDIFNQGAPRRGEDNTTAKQGEPVYPDGPPQSDDVPVPEYGGGGSGVVEPTRIPESPEGDSTQVPTTHDSKTETSK